MEVGLPGLITVLTRDGLHKSGVKHCDILTSHKNNVSTSGMLYNSMVILDSKHRVCLKTKALLLRVADLVLTSV